MGTTTPGSRLVRSASGRPVVRSGPVLCTTTTAPMWTGCSRPLLNWPANCSVLSPERSRSARLTWHSGSVEHAGTGMIHHIELWVPNLTRAEASWGWLLVELGYQPFIQWPEGQSWRAGAIYIVLE